jgi:hypothetical protein
MDPADAKRMRTCTPERLHAQADAIEHAAARGGWIDPTHGVRHTLTQRERDAWQRDAAALREAARQMEQPK